MENGFQPNYGDHLEILSYINFKFTEIQKSFDMALYKVIRNFTTQEKSLIESENSEWFRKVAERGEEVAINFCDSVTLSTKNVLRPLVKDSRRLCMNRTKAPAERDQTV